MAQVEIIVGAGSEMMPIAHQRRNVLLRLIENLRRRRAAHDVVEPHLPFDLLHHRRIGHEEVIVLVLTRR